MVMQIVLDYLVIVQKPSGTQHGGYRVTII